MKPMVRYHMHFSGKCHSWSAFFAGVSFFAIVLYYYILGNYQGVEGVDAFWNIYAPLGVLGIYMLTCRVFKIDHLLVYAGIALLYIIVLSVQNFASGASLWVNILETGIYGLCFAAMVFSGLGYIPGKWYIAFVLLLCAAGRVWLRDFAAYLQPLNWKAALPDLARLCGVLCLSWMCFALKAEPIKQKNAERV